MIDDILSDEEIDAAKDDLELARELNDLWTDLERNMGEMAAYHVACEQLGIDPDDGWDLLATLSEGEEE